MADPRAAISHYQGVKEVKQGIEYKAFSPLRSEKERSVSIKIDGDKILIHDFGAPEKKGHEIHLAAGGNMEEIMPEEKDKKLESWKRDLEAEYPYHDRSGQYSHSKLRYEGKKLVYAQTEGKFQWGRGDNDPILYRLPELVEAVKHHKTIFVTEGEKDADNLVRRGLVATTPGGVSDWKSEFADDFTGADVVLLPDNDEAGRDLMRRIKEDLKSVALSIRTVITSEVEKGDVTDWFNEGHTKEDLLSLVNDTEPEKSEAKKIISNVVTLAQFSETPPERPPVLIDGVLRTGHKLLISGPSKAGKSFLLMLLSICIATGRSWLGFDCKQGRVLYINLEIDGSSATCRFLRIAKELGYDAHDLGGVDLWNLRGMAKPLPDLIPEIIELAEKMGPYVAIIIDPIYKVIIGDENSASDMGAFCNCFDRISAATGAAVIYAHHHSKGSQGQKRSIDRASGSGVFGRDPDAILDLCPLEIPEEVKRYTGKGQGYPFRVETSLREFPASDPFDVWFRYPVHVLDDTGLLDGAAPAGTSIGNLAKTGKYTTSESRRLSVLAAWETCSEDFNPVTVSAMAAQMDVTTRTARDRINEQSDFVVKNGTVNRA